MELVSDVGVAGIHRLFHRLDVIQEANVLVVCAGMEGALASVIGGLVKNPVIAVPTCQLRLAMGLILKGYLHYLPCLIVVQVA